MEFTVFGERLTIESIITIPCEQCIVTMVKQRELWEHGS